MFSNRNRVACGAARGGLLLALATAMLGCSSGNREVYLIDGRVFKPETSHNDGRHVFFALDGWEYTLPLAVVTNRPAVPPRGVVTITVSSNAISRVGWVYNGLDGLFLYLDLMATQTNPVIVRLPDIYLWPREKQEAFGTAYGGNFSKRPYVGLEAYWGEATADRGNEP